MQCALVSFAEVAASGLAPEYRTLHLLECVEVMLQRDDRCEPLSPAPGTASTHSASRKHNPSSTSGNRCKKVCVRIHVTCLVYIN